MFQEVNTQKWDGLNAALPQLNIIPLTPVQESKPVRALSAMGENPTFLAAFVAGRALVHLALRPAADPRLSLLHLGADARRDAGHRRRAPSTRGAGAASRARRLDLLHPRLLVRLHLLRRGGERARASSCSSGSGCSRRSPPSSSSCSACTRWACCASAGFTARSACRWSKKPTSLFGAFFVGLAFAFGWTPCIGPILAGILAIAGTQETVGQGVRLLAVYSAGPRPAVPADGARHQPVLHAFARRSASTTTLIEDRLGPAARPRSAC